MIDFAGGELAFYLADPGQVQLVPTTSAGRITHTFVMPNDHIEGFRAAIDVKLDPGQSTDLRAFLKASAPSNMAPLSLSSPATQVHETHRPLHARQQPPRPRQPLTE